MENISDWPLEDKTFLFILICLMKSIPISKLFFLYFYALSIINLGLIKFYFVKITFKYSYKSFCDFYLLYICFKNEIKWSQDLHGMDYI